MTLPMTLHVSEGGACAHGGGHHKAPEQCNHFDTSEPLRRAAFLGLCGTSDYCHTNGFAGSGVNCYDYNDTLDSCNCTGAGGLCTYCYD
jgi:hypothetical protein